MPISSLSLPDTILKPGICTSTTRPSAPYEGQTIYETDTDRVMFHNGTGWVILSEPPVTMTPTISGVTLGTGGTLTGTYHRSDGFCDFYFSIVLGTGGTVTGIINVNTPFTASSLRELACSPSNVYFQDNGTNNFQGILNAANNFTVSIFAMSATGAFTTPNTTTPFTWTVSDNIEGYVRFPMAVRHSY